MHRGAIRFVLNDLVIVLIKTVKNFQGRLLFHRSLEKELMVVICENALQDDFVKDSKMQDLSECGISVGDTLGFMNTLSISLGVIAKNSPS